MTKDELLSKLKAARTELELQLNGLTSEQLIHRATRDSWSIKDLIAHITFWEQTMVNNIRKITRGEHGEYIAGDVDTINEQVFAANQTRPPGLILTEFQRSYKELIEALEPLSNDDLVDPDRFAFHDEPLWKYVWTESGEHYGDHNGDLYAMIQQVKTTSNR